MSRVVSLIGLAVVLVVIGWLFVEVMAQFLLPLFLAVLLVVVTRPVHQWFLRNVSQRSAVAAGCTTAFVVVIVLAPLTWLLTSAAQQAWGMFSQVDQRALLERVQERGQRVLDGARNFGERYGIQVPSNEEIVNSGTSQLRDWLAPAALRTTQFLGSLLLGAAIMIVALYYFLADGPQMVYSLTQLTPLDRGYQEQLLVRFDQITRSVVLATLLGAVAQGVLCGLGYTVAGLGQVLLLSVLTMLFSFVPIIGSAVIWGGASLWLYTIDGRTGAAITLAIWCVLAGGVADYVLKPMILRGQSNLHPLLALLSVIGGIDLLGPVGIFVGPMVVVFLQAVLVILRRELDQLDLLVADQGDKTLPAPASARHRDVL